MVRACCGRVCFPFYLSGFVSGDFFPRSLSSVDMAKRGLTDEVAACKLYHDLEESDVDLSEEDVVDDSDDDVDYVQEEVSGSSDSEEESRCPSTSAASNPVDIVPVELARLMARGKPRPACRTDSEEGWTTTDRAPDIDL
ncbi:uncharacterized protein LOC124596329 [Schistocerca americana]|uniref:uncharacterized protein LOC124596329 n=1 Tax=Schistocerca americana TaxID=7009 RepID=UPI001F4F7285|nr:uncharacterized protein LOC124596329 [Schistocerca americana]